MKAVVTIKLNNAASTNSELVDILWQLVRHTEHERRAKYEIGYSRSLFDINGKCVGQLVIEE